MSSTAPPVKTGRNDLDDVIRVISFLFFLKNRISQPVLYQFKSFFFKYVACKCPKLIVVQYRIAGVPLKYNTFNVMRLNVITPTVEENAKIQ